jgi:hypothetical protein
MFYLLLDSALVATGLCMLYLLRACLRGLAAPRCWHCGMRKLRPSRKRAPLDGLASLCLLKPLRCRSCRARAHVLDVRRGNTAAAIPNKLRLVIRLERLQVRHS